MVTLCWHYTTGLNFESIVRDGLIRPATARVPPGERPIVWFSVNSHWEYTVGKLLEDANGQISELSMDQMYEQCGGLVRFGVTEQTAPYDWKQLKALSGMSANSANRLQKSATRMGAYPHEWRGTFEPVPTRRWVAIDTFRDGRWVRGWDADTDTPL